MAVQQGTMEGLDDPVESILDKPLLPESIINDQWINNYQNISQYLTYIFTHKQSFELKNKQSNFAEDIHLLRRMSLTQWRDEALPEQLVNKVYIRGRKE